MGTSSVSEQLMDRRIAFLAWEGVCERLHNAFSHNSNVPQLTQEELRQTIAQAQSLLKILEDLHCADD